MSDVSQEFRNAMAHLGAAVNILTTDGPAGRVGLTATAVCSVTDAPPTLLVCINRSSSGHPFFKGNGRLCVNVLAADQEEIGKHFAGMTELTMEERFKLHGWTTGADQQPRLTDALAVLEGKIVDIHEIGTHSIMFVELDYIGAAEKGDALVYYSRKFHRVPRNIPV